MLTKATFILIDFLAIVDIFFTVNALGRMKEDYARYLSYALKAAVVAILANMLIAISFHPAFAEISYALYFASINWIVLFLAGFGLLYTEHQTITRTLTKPAVVLIGLDTLSLAGNVIFHHVYSVYEKTDLAGIVYYQTVFKIPYYIHLAIDYTMLVVVLLALLYRIRKNYSMYRIKYVLILAVLLLVVLMNLAYMTLELALDASVVFYAVAGTLIYFCIQIFVPRSLMNVAIGRAIDDMNEGLILFDLSHKCIYANAFSKVRLRLDTSEIGLDREPLATILKSIRERGTEYGQEPYVKRIENENGQVLEMHYNFRYNELTDVKGRSIGSYFLIEDTTENFRHMEEIRIAKENADAANQAKSSFLASMSHEIRTPLNSVLGLNEMILRSTEDPQLKEYAENIRASGDALLGLISDILDFSKIEAKRMEVKPAPYSMHHLLRDCYNNFIQMAGEKGLYIRIDCDETIPASLVGDVKLIRQILNNIISNGIKYTKVGGLSLRVTASAVEENTCDLRMEISDTGIGIPEEEIGHLFDAFRRINEKENATIQGTGLGLTITKELVTLMDGTITVHSTLGKGSTFRVTLPQKVADAAASGEFRLHEVDSAKNQYHELFHAPDAQILLVDDVSMNLKVVKALLKKTQVQVETAGGGLEAMEKCRQKKYDLILLDHRMPEPDGIETFKVIRTDGLNTETPVIMLTANVVSGAEEEYEQLGFAGYLSKPVRGEELEKAMAGLLPKKMVTYV